LLLKLSNLVIFSHFVYTKIRVESISTLITILNIIIYIAFLYVLYTSTPLSLPNDFIEFRYNALGASDAKTTSPICKTSSSLSVFLNAFDILSTIFFFS